MKIKTLILSSFMTLAMCVNVQAYTAYFAVDNTLDFNILDGFEVMVDQSVVANPLTDLTLTAYHQSGTPAMTGSGSVPDKFADTVDLWDIFSAIYGASGAQEYEELGGISGLLVPGTVISLEWDGVFFGSEFVLNASSADGGFYPDYTVNITDVADGTLYTATTSAVPIPGAVWLLGSGLAGMVAMRRKKK